MTYHWDFGDGATSTEANPTHTYVDAGNHTALLTVTDSMGRSSVAAVRIAAGNTAPEVAFQWPPHGGFYDWGDTFDYEVVVDDAEDGSTADGTIACEEVDTSTFLGHDTHAHPVDNYTGCEGSVTILPDAGHDVETDLYFVLESSYTDKGAPGVTPLTGSDGLRLNPKRTEAEHFSDASGVGVYDRDQASGGARIGDITDGDWVRYEPVNLANIDAVTLGVSSGGLGGTVEFRRDAPDGDLLGTATVPVTGDYNTVVEVTAELEDPGETFTLYAVFRNPAWTEGGPDLLAFDWMEFQGAGVADQSAPRVTVDASVTEGRAPLAVELTGTATSPVGQEIVSYEWDFGDGASATGADAEHVYTTAGEYLAVLTVTDAEGRKGSAGVRITVGEPLPVCERAGSDEFDGDSLDLGRWCTTLHHDPDGYQVTGGRLVLPTAHGELNGSQFDAPNLVLQPAPSDPWQVTTQVTLEPTTGYQQAGLLLMADSDHFAKAVMMGRPDGTRRMSFFTVAGGQERNQAADFVALPADFPSTFQLRLSSDGAVVTAEYSADGEQWSPLGRSYGVGSSDLWHVGVAALSGGGGDSTIPVVDAAFDWFRMTTEEPQQCQAPAPPEGFTALWDGQTLDGWQMVGGGSFAVTGDCTLMSQGGGGMLWYTPEAFGDFHLSLEYRMNNASDNSGVFMRFPAPWDWEGAWSSRPDDSVRGYEAQIEDNAGGGDPQKTGSIYNFASINQVLAKPIGEWNTYEIRAVGQTYEVTLNGEVVNTYTGDGSRALEGHIGLQAHHNGSDVEFRNIWISTGEDVEPEPSFEGVRELLVGLVETGAVSPQGETVLTRTLDQAESRCTAGQVDAAVRLLEAFATQAANPRLVPDAAAQDELVGAADGLRGWLADQ